MARTWILLFAVFWSGHALPLLAQPTGYPSRSIRLIVPYAPGGVADLMSRIIAQKLGPYYNQQIVVDNRAGSGGHVGADIAIKAPPDGYTIVFATIAHNCAYAMYSRLPYDPARDLQPIILLAEIQGVLVVHPSLPTRTLKEFLSLARNQPGELNYGSAGAGSATHMAAELFKLVARVNLTHVAYKGSGPAMIDLIGGHIQLMFENVPTAAPFIKSGKVRALGVTSRQRVASLPDVPAIAESGVPEYEAVPYYTMSASSKVPQDIVRKLNADLDTVLKLPELAPRWTELGITVLGGSQEAAMKRNAVETETWTKVIKAAGIRAD
ncbi:MAG: Bug family tripartite tricarboxylate transporter substrate binding protein [Burkholderiales bacterium]